MENCPKCDQIVTDGAMCNGCRCVLHYACAGVSESNHRKLSVDKKSSWRCPSCRASITSEPTLAQVLKETQSFRADFQSVKDDVESNKQSLRDFQNKWTEFDSRFDKLDGRLQDIEVKVQSLPKVQVELKEANEKIAELQETVDRHDQLSRMNNVEILGIPARHGENLYSILSDVSAKVGITLSDADVDYVTRVRRYPETLNGGKTKPREPAIIVRFAQRRSKDKLMAAVRSRRGLTTTDIGFSGPSNNIFIHEHLTPKNKLLLNRSREYKTEHNYAFVWVRDCKILMRKSESSPIIRISGEADLHKLK